MLVLYFTSPSLIELNFNFEFTQPKLLPTELLDMQINNRIVCTCSMFYIHIQR